MNAADGTGWPGFAPLNVRLSAAERKTIARLLPALPRLAGRARGVAGFLGAMLRVRVEAADAGPARRAFACDQTSLLGRRWAVLGRGWTLGGGAATAGARLRVLIGPLKPAEARRLRSAGWTAADPGGRPAPSDKLRAAAECVVPFWIIPVWYIRIEAAPAAAWVLGRRGDGGLGRTTRLTRPAGQGAES